MERLTIKELAPYLPYDLTVIGNINGIYTECCLTTCNIESHIQAQSKPLLRPLSQLADEIEHNSISIQLEPNLEKVKPSELIYKHWFYTIREDGHFSYHIGDGTVTGSLYRGVPYSLIELLIEWHFDVFGLTDRGLALPIDGKEVEG